MKKRVNGVIVDMTDDDIAELESLVVEPTYDTPEDRIALLEAQNKALMDYIGLSGMWNGQSFELDKTNKT